MLHSRQSRQVGESVPKRPPAPPSRGAMSIARLHLLFFARVWAAWRAHLVGLPAASGSHRLGEGAFKQNAQQKAPFVFERLRQAGCPTAEKPAKKRKAQEEGEDRATCGLRPPSFESATCRAGSRAGGTSRSAAARCECRPQARRYSQHLC